jgi:hypothetical protein
MTTESAAKARLQDVELSERLDSWLAGGLRQLVVVDEFVSGSQLRTAFLRISSWHERKAPFALNVLLIGVREALEPADANYEFREKVYLTNPTSTAAGLNFSHKLIEVPKLYAMDNQGRAFKSVRKNREGEYEPNRVWTGGYKTTCPKRLTIGGGAEASVLWTAGSLDSIFAELVYAVCGFGFTQPNQWPETIQNYKCEVCRARLSEARNLADGIARRIRHPINEVGRVIGPAIRRGRTEQKPLDTLELPKKI